MSSRVSGVMLANFANQLRESVRYGCTDQVSSLLQEIQQRLDQWGFHLVAGESVSLNVDEWDLLEHLGGSPEEVDIRVKGLRQARLLTVFAAFVSGE